MKHMKRALSLVLAMVMLLGMFVVPTGAVSNFTDEAEITYDEAVEVTSGLGLFAGSDGKFLPKGTVTRAQMATIIVKMLHGSEANADSFKGVNGGFTDTASFEGGWAEGYINWCASLGVVAGYGDGTFRPGQAVTTAEAATMILNALQIDAGAGSWPFTVMSKAEELKFFKDLTPKPDTNQALTREELAVIAFHGLEYSPEGKMGYVYNGVVYDDYMAAYLAANRDASKVDPAKKDSLAADVFGLKSVTGFVTGNQATGLDYTEVKVAINGAMNTYKFAIETDQTAIGHYVTVYYDEQYKNEKEPGTTYTIFDETTMVEVTEDIDSRADFRDAFGSASVKLSTVEACVITANYAVKAGYPKATGGFTANDVTFVTGNTYDVPAGTYILDGNTIMSYIAPAAVYASVIDGVETYEGEETITLRGVLDPIPNNEGDDMIDEYVAMKAGDYVTYTMVGPRYVLERVRVVTGTVSSLSKTEINGVEYDTVTVDGVDYVKFNGTDATNLNNDVTQLNYVDTYDFYTTRDGKFIGFEASDGGINLDNVAYILGVLSTAEKDSYGDQVITYSARGVDMNGVETLIPLALVEDTNGNGVWDSGEEILGDETIAKGGSLAENFYAVKDHPDKEERKENIKVLTAYGATYDKETSPVFTSDYTLRNLVFGGYGTFGSNYALKHNNSKYLTMEGSVTQSTALSATVKTGSCSVSMNNNIVVAKALLTREDSGAYMIEAMIFRVASAAAVGGTTIYVSKDKNTPVSNTADGYVYDVYAASTGKAMQITMKNSATLTPGFYQVAQDAETKQYEFVAVPTEAGKPVGYVLPTEASATKLKEYGTTASAADGLPNSAVCYDIPFSFMASSNMTAGTITNVNASGVVVVDTRTKEEMDASRVSAITSVDRMSSLRLANENMTIKMDIFFNSSSDKMTAVYITDVGDPSADSRKGSLLVSNADTNSFKVVVTKDAAKLPLDSTYTLDAGMDLSINCSSGSTCNHTKGLFVFEGSTPAAVVLTHVSTDVGAGNYGLHNVVIHADGNNWVLTDAHTNTTANGNTGYGCTAHTYCYDHDADATEASMYLDVSDNTIKVYDFAGTGITTMAALRTAVANKLTNRMGSKESQYVLSYYCAEGWGDKKPEAIFIMATNGPLYRNNSYAQPVWRVAEGEWAFYNADSGTADLTTVGGGLHSRTFYVPVDGTIPSSGVFMHYAEVEGMTTVANEGQGVYKAVANEFGRVTLVYQTPVEITEVSSNAVLLKGVTGASTIGDVRNLIAAQDSKIMGHKMTTGGKDYVYVESVEESLRQVTLNDGDRITIANAFDANAGYVEAIVTSTTVANAPANWNCMVKFDAASATVAGDYQVSVSGGTITLNKLVTRDIADLTAADLAAADTVTFAAGVYADYKTTTWLNTHVSDALLTVKAKETIAGDTSTIEILSITYTVPAGVVLYMAKDPKDYYNKGCGEFYVMDNNGVTYLAEGTKQFFTFDTTYFFTNGASTSGEQNRVYCYGWKDGYLLSSGSMGLRYKDTSTSNYLKTPIVTDAATAFGTVSGTSKFNGCSGYHRVVTGVSNNTMTVTNRKGGTSNLNCDGHGFIGSCWLATHSNTKTSLTLSASTVIVDARNGETVSLAEFATMAATTKLVVNFYTTTSQGTNVAYVVVTGLAPLS